MDQMHILLTVAVVICVAAIGFLATRKSGTGAEGDSKAVAAKIIETAEREAELLRKSVELEVRGKELEIRGELEAEQRGKQEQILALEKKLSDREAGLATEQESLSREREALATRKQELAATSKRLTETLEQASGMSAEKAREALIRQVEEEARFEAAKRARQIEEEARASAEESAKHVITTAVQRLAGDFVVESTVSVVKLPSDDMKGRLIGREGRNIRAIEAATGVNLIIDDTPGVILLSSFDPLRREVARQTIEKLLADGRVHPTSIEETAAKVREKLDREMREAANEVLFDLDVRGLHDDMVGLLGKLKYRLSYGQNNLQHAAEVGRICGLMASELGLDAKLATRAGLLHDIGKSLSHEQEGGHAEIGARFAEKCGESPEVVNAIASHHGDMAPTTKEAYLVAAADALSAGRPGARRENMDLYVKRMEDLEDVAGSFPGVDKAYAMQAGREVRVLVDADALSDGECSAISRDIAKRIENELSYPGQIRICLVRESRFIEYAR